jgi:hypothetical protein
MVLAAALSSPQTSPPPPDGFHFNLGKKILQHMLYKSNPLSKGAFGGCDMCDSAILKPPKQSTNQPTNQPMVRACFSPFFFREETNRRIGGRFFKNYSKK